MSLLLNKDYFASLAIQKEEEASTPTDTASKTKEIIRVVCFRLGREEYGISIANVLEIIKIIPITPTPHTPEFVLGVINLRSEIYTVLDLGLMVGMGSFKLRHPPGIMNREETEAGEAPDPAIIVLHLDDKIFAILVDKITGMINSDQAQILPPPTVVEGLPQQVIKEILKVEERLVLVVVLRDLISSEPLNSMERESFFMERDAFSKRGVGGGPPSLAMK